MGYNIGVQIRMNKLFSRRNVFIVAADHRTTMGPQVGLDIRNIGQLVDKYSIDGIVIRPGMAKELITSSLKNTCVMMYLTGKLDRGIDHVMFNTVEYAVSCGADVVCSEFKFGSEGDLKNTYDCSRISEIAHQHGIPHLITTYVQSNQLKRMGDKAYTHACVIAEELGADIIKIGLTDNKNIMKECIKAVDIPIVIAGGTQEELEVLSNKVKKFINYGGAGVVMGRNIWGVPNSEIVIRKIKDCIYK